MKKSIATKTAACGKVYLQSQSARSYNHAKKRIFTTLIAIALFSLAACQSASTPGPENQTAPLPTLTAAPSIGDEFRLVSTTPPPLPTKASGDGILGEWAGYIGKSTSPSLYSKELTYAAKLTLTKDGAFLSLDKLTQDFDVTYIEDPIDNCGAWLNVDRLGESAVSLTIQDYAYRQNEKSPFPVGGKIELGYYHFESREERETSEIAWYTPAYVETATNDMLYGSLGDWTVSLARLEDGPDEDSTYPYWRHSFNDFTENVRGMYGFGERGADNDFSTCVFVYEDEKGVEHIRATFGDIGTIPERKVSGVFALSWPMERLGLSFMDTPWWYTLYKLDVKTGRFIDVSAEYREYYRDVRLPYAKQNLLYYMRNHYPGNSGDEALALREFEAYEEFYACVYEAAYGERPTKLPEIPMPEANSRTLTTDIDGDGDDETVSVMFYDYLNEASTDYNSVWFCIDGQWQYETYIGNGLVPDFFVIDIWENAPGMEVAFETETGMGPRVFLYKLHKSGGMAVIGNDELWGTLLGGPSSQLYFDIHGNGTASGRRRSVFSPEITVEFDYYDSMGFLNLAAAKDGFYKLTNSRELVLKKPFRAYFEQDTTSQAVEVFAGQRITPLLSNEYDWFKFSTASGQEFFAYCDASEDYPEFK